MNPNMKRFKYISALVIVVLILLAAVQILWLKEMYSAKLADFNYIVKSAITDAAYENYVERGFGKQDETLRKQIQETIFNEDTDNIKSIEVFNNDDEGRMIISVEKSVPNSNSTKKTNITVTFLETPDKNNFNKFNQTLLTKLREQGIFASFRSSLLNKEDNKVLFTKDFVPDSTKLLSSNLLRFDTDYVRVDKRQSVNKRISNRIDTRVIMIDGKKDTAQSGIKIIRSKVMPDTLAVATVNGGPASATTASKETYYYKVEIENPFNDTIKDIAGIIISSVLIIVVIGLMFLYLLRTIIRQKRLEEMKDDFTHNITHELKTPVSVAYAANDALLNYNADEDPQKRKRYLAVISTQLKSLETMIERILILTKEKERGMQLNKEQFSLSELVEEVKDEMLCHSENTDKTVEISVNTDNCGNITADRFHLKNMLLNLVENSVKYSGSSVKIAINCSIDNGKLKIVVADNGNGMSQGSIKYIFDKYYRESNGDLYNVKGVGLGLYYVKMVVTAHGGTINVESRYKKGTTFTIKIPII